MTINDMKTGVIALLLLALSAPAAAARASLNGMDQKLDDLLTTVGAAAQPVSVSTSITVDDEGDSLFVEVFEVPAGKILVVEYFSLYLDVVVGNRPSSGLRIRSRLEGFTPAEGYARFETGYMEEFAFTSRGTPNFVIAQPMRAYFGPGQVLCFALTQFGGVNLDFGSATCSLSGRLIGVPGTD